MIPLWIWIIAVLLVVGIAVAVLLSSYENKRLTVEYYEIESEKIPEAFDGYRIVFLTDLHCACLLYTSPSPRDGLLSRMPSSA